MAKVLGESGRYVADQARAKRLKWIIVGLINVALTAASAGFLFGRALSDKKVPPLVAISIASALLLGVLALGRWCVRRMDVLEKERLHMMRTAS